MSPRLMSETGPDGISSGSPVDPDFVGTFVTGGQPIDVNAVVFDYFGTLTVHASDSARRSGVHRVASKLGVPPGLLSEAIFSTFTERATGRVGDVSATMKWLAQVCGYEATSAQIADACAERARIEEEYARMVRPEAIATLRWLRARGLRIGVVSDCTHELPDCWTSLAVAPWVDATVFSIEMGERKPHPSLYMAASQRLGVAPTETIYVGDGGSNELSGAEAVGMSAIRLVAADAAGALVYDPERDWTGPVVNSLTAFTSHRLLCTSRTSSATPGPDSSDRDLTKVRTDLGVPG